MMTDEAIHALVEAKDAVDRVLAAAPARNLADVLTKAERAAEMIREDAGGERFLDDCDRAHIAMVESLAADLRRFMAN